MQRSFWFMAAGLLLATAAQAQTYRCGNSYSDAPCKGGRLVDTTPPVTNNSTADAVGSKTIYLCQGGDGGRFWSSQHCREHGAYIDRMEKVPANLPWETQVEMAKGQRDKAANLQQPAPVQPGYQQQAPAPNKQLTCQSLESRIKQLDSMARAGGTAQQLDWIAARRKEARDEQFRLRC